MSVHKLKDGRWMVNHRKGADPSRPEANKTYFGRGLSAERAARDFDANLKIRNPEQPSPCFMELVNAYMESKENTLAASTIARWSVRMHGTILPAIGAEMSHSLTPSRIDQYASARIATGVKRVTVHREVSDIRAVLKWAVKRKFIPANPMDGYEMPTLDNARIQPPTEAEFSAIYQCAVPHLQRAMLIAYCTGLRPGREELLCLKWDAVDFIGKTLMVISAVKGGLPRRMVPLNKEILNHLGKWYDEDRKAGVGCIVHYNGAQVGSLKTAWRNAKGRARVMRRIRLYDIRHAFITTLLERGADLKSVSEIVGHASPDMTMRVYQHVSSELKRQAVDLLGSGVTYPMAPIRR